MTSSRPTITHPLKALALAAVVPLLLAGCTSGVTAAGEPAEAASGPSAGPLEPTGATSPIHDPALIVADGVWYVFSTGYVKREQGGTVRIARSLDQGQTWESAGSVWDAIPGWIDDWFAERGDALPDNLWAPEIVEHDGTFYLYYSASTFGKNISLTALATNTTLDPDDPDYRWVDQGVVLESPVEGLAGDSELQMNAIDAGVVEDEDRRPHLAIGSFWNGIFSVPISWPSGKPAEDWAADAEHLAERPGVEFNPIEAPYIVQREGYYYLFTSWDFCCRGADSTYKIAVGRAESVNGPYRDQRGRPMLDGGGNVLLETDGARVGAGGQSVFGDTLAYHYYDTANTEAPGIPTLGLATLRWVDGWPTVER